MAFRPDFVAEEARLGPRKAPQREGGPGRPNPSQPRARPPPPGAHGQVRHERGNGTATGSRGSTKKSRAHRIGNLAIASPRRWDVLLATKGGRYVRTHRRVCVLPDPILAMHYAPACGSAIPAAVSVNKEFFLWSGRWYPSTSLHIWYARRL
jgi:hypothetical protein